MTIWCWWVGSFRQLRPGRSRIRGSHELAAHLGVSQRQIGSIVHRARELGYAVGSAHGEGYYLIQNEAELSMTIAHIERRIPGLRHTVRLLRSAWERQIEEE